MSSPQQGIFQEGSNQFYHLEYRIDRSVPGETIRSVLKQALSSSSSDVQLVCAFGRWLWDQLQPGWAPADLQDFQTLKGVDDFCIPSTQRDLLIWLHGTSHDENLETVLKIQELMGEVAELELDLPGFTYRDSRDLTGFIDGTANPKEDQRQLAALIPAGLPGAGGSYVLTQKWVHNLKAFHQLSEQQQERVIGRTKKDSIELEGDAMPANSHVSRTDVKVDGKAMKIYRRSAPYGTATENGLYFLSFACEIERFSVQLERMFGTSGDGLHDALIHYSRPVTSAYWFAPSAGDLQALLED
ncbi:Dyp-type peroxidase [Dongshaea marina]|uniref:Dyp-type peroxidase n=1 Tax=Dongshaea marina TaxID=2047966 RepID=UPI000D3EAD1C|nr:Dyp-type peroxidase [Dongshaea marina]